MVKELATRALRVVQRSALGVFLGCIALVFAAPSSGHCSDLRHGGIDVTVDSDGNAEIKLTLYLSTPLQQKELDAMSQSLGFPLESPSRHSTGKSPNERNRQTEPDEEEDDESDPD